MSTLLPLRVWVTVLPLLLAFAAPAASATDPVRNGRLAFSTDSRHPSQIYTMRRDGSGVRQLTHATKGHPATSPSWSPDGTRIAFTTDDQVWVMAADGSGQVRLTGRAGYSDRTPSWSPDGKRIVFSRCNVQLGFEAYCDIDRVGADGGAVTTVLHDTWQGAQPEYSPDGRKLVFTSDRHGFVSAVWVMNADGSRPRRLTNPVLQANNPDWAPNGRHILFGINADRASSQVWVMRSDGTHQHRLTSFGPTTDAPLGRYSPNGRRVAVLGPNTRHPHICCWDVYVMRSDGTHAHVLDGSPAGVGGLDWGARPMP